MRPRAACEAADRATTMKTKFFCTVKDCRHYAKCSTTRETMRPCGRSNEKYGDAPLWSRPQMWHDKFVELAMQMGRESHEGPQAGLRTAGNWMIRAAYRIKEGRDVYTGRKPGQ